ncbi:minor tail protein [Corynebacterium phage EmiRose]|uniref:Minor tail protein n=1 Tax=Corynebacterium phage EmiRose TaxID=2565372 RepID=A0A649VNV9_9CAUD|nr:minor tail protein [Corynebacterium phage EmiRose]QGJ94150.1 minor tail protein [Corynebacterium phage EmiRose]
MPFTALAVENSQIGPAQFADLIQSLAPRCTVDGPDDLRPSYASGAISVAAGAATIAGTRIRATGTNSISLPYATSGTITYVVVLRIDWSQPEASAASLKYFRWPAGGISALINATTTKDTNKINRIPGVMYDCVLASVILGTSASQQNMFTDYRAWGGDGGPLRVSSSLFAQGQEFMQLLDARRGTMITTEQGLYTRRLDNDGVWRDVGTASNPWRQWTPTLRFSEDFAEIGNTGGKLVNLGSGGQMKGYYRVTDGLVDGFASIIPGTGNWFGKGPIFMDLPLPCADWMVDTWSDGHIYTQQNLNWAAQLLVKAGWTRGEIFVPAEGKFSDQQPHRASLDNNPGTGIPRLDNAYSGGEVYSFHISYPVQSLRAM